MQTATHKNQKKYLFNPKKLIKRAALRKLASNGLTNKNGLNFNSSTKPLKKANRNVLRYIAKKPYESIGIATLFSGICLGFAYAKFKASRAKYFWWK